MSASQYFTNLIQQIHLDLENITISLGIGFVTIILMLCYLWSKKKEVPVLRRLISSEVSPKPRFRKREKFMFYGRKVLRTVKHFARSNVNSSGGRRGIESRKKKIVMSIARRLLRFKKEQPQLKVREPPPSLLEVDWPELDYEHRLPSELMYMLRNVRVLGHFEKPIFLELCRFMESRFIPMNSYLFKIGDADDSIYVVQAGKVHVFITEQDGKEYFVKEVNNGESIHSLLSIMDVLTGHPARFKTVSAVAVTDSTILRLPAHAFHIVLERFPESMVRVIQIIMIRLQRVTFMALHNYLGLSSELVNPENQSDKNFKIHSLTPPCYKGSPAHGAGGGGGSLKEGRVAPAGAENESALKITAAQPLPLLDDEDMPAGGIPVEGRRRVHRKYSDSAASRTAARSSDNEEWKSDFEMARSRARVGSLIDDDPNHFVSTSPPVRSGADDALSSQLGTPSRRVKKVSILPVPSVSTPLPSDAEILAMATQDIAGLFGLKDESLLIGKCRLQSFRSGTILVKQGDEESNIYFVVTGLLQVQQQMIGNEQEQRTMHLVHPGELVGPLPVLTGEPSFFTVRIMTDARLIVISKNDFYSIMKEQPKIVLNIGHTVVQRMSAFVRQIDYALDWMLIEAGRALYRQGEHSDCLYIILNGRIRSVVQLQSGKKELVGEYGRGELVGLVEVLTQTNRSTTMMAVRDTELAQIPDELLNLIKRKYPQIVTRLIHLLGQRILGSLGNRTHSMNVLSEHPNVEPRPTVANLATVAILPCSAAVPLSNFTLELHHALNGIGPTLSLTSEIVQNKLGNAAFDSINEYRLSSWLGQQEDIHRMVLYQCDLRMTPWTQRCIRQADCILIIAIADQEPSVGQLEKQMETVSVRAQKEFILLHRLDGPQPKNTVEWLNLRDWCSSHRHIRCPKRVFSKKPQPIIMELYKNLCQNPPDPLSDCSRLARFLTGTSIGVVLGGGGARGCAHVGIIQAMAEAGIPIDIIGGTSIGSFMGALWAEETNVTRFKQRAREWAKDMNSLWKLLPDLTYPVTAMFSGASFNKKIESVFHERQIEDLWIPYFCVTTDLTASKMRVHTHGCPILHIFMQTPYWQELLFLGSLWRYVRSSMSLAGYIPPLCDPMDGHLLLDGGYVNNLPADALKAMGAQTVIAIDVGSQDEMDLTNYGDTLSGWWLLWKRWNPWADPVRVPNMAEIQSRLAYVSCVRQLEQVKDSGYCEYIRPAIDKYHTLQFGSFDEISDVGYTHGKVLFTEWAKTGRIKELFVERQPADRPNSQKSTVPAEANFTDLAELISRIDEPQSLTKGTSRMLYGETTDDDDERMSVTSEPIVSMNSPHVKHRARAGSEGAFSPDSMSVSSADSAEEDDGEDDDPAISHTLPNNLNLDNTTAESSDASPVGSPAARPLLPISSSTTPTNDATASPGTTANRTPASPASPFNQAASDNQSVHIPQGAEELQQRSTFQIAGQEVNSN